MSVGQHVLVDMHKCNSEKLKNVETIKNIMLGATKVSKATIVGEFFKQFDPYGVSGVVIISESHLTIHTWPEYGLASIDYFSCSESVDINKAVAYIKNELESNDLRTSEISRGDMQIKRFKNIIIDKEAVNEVAI